MEADWGQGLLDLLNTVARRHCFDWVAVAEELSQSISQPVSAEACRQTFASINLVTPPPRPKRLDELQDFTLDQLVEHVEALEESMRIRKEVIFQRVLDSLGGALPADQVILSEEAQQIMQDARDRKALREAAAAQKAEEAAERRRLDEDRERLRRRFDPDSVDSVGEDPLAAIGHGAVHALVRPPSPVHAEALSSSLQFDLPDELDVILSELEKELAEAADGKADEDSELAEVLRMLDGAATQAQAASRPKLEEMPTPPPPAPMKQVHVPMVKATVPPMVPAVPAPAPQASTPAPAAPAPNRGRAAYAVTADSSGSEDEDGNSAGRGWQAKRQALKARGASVPAVPSPVPIRSTPAAVSMNDATSGPMYSAPASPIEEVLSIGQDMRSAQQAVVEFSSDSDSEHDEEASTCPLPAAAQTVLSSGSLLGGGGGVRRGGGRGIMTAARRTTARPAAVAGNTG